MNGRTQMSAARCRRHRDAHVGQVRRRRHISLAVLTLTASGINIASANAVNSHRRSSQDLCNGAIALDKPHFALVVNDPIGAGDVVALCANEYVSSVLFCSYLRSEGCLHHEPLLYSCLDQLLFVLPSSVSARSML